MKPMIQADSELMACFKAQLAVVHDQDDVLPDLVRGMDLCQSLLIHLAL